MDVNVLSRNGRGAWEALSIYESTELVERLYKKKHGAKPPGQKAREIVSHFSQGREYFRNAAGASELVRPLILQYGTISLSRGLVLFLDASKSKVKAGHGLGAEGWPDLNNQPTKVSSLPVTIHSKGTFPELCRATKNLDRARIPAEDNPFEIGSTSSGTDPVTGGTKITVKEILGQVPELQDVYESTFDDHPSRLLCEVLAVNHISGREADEGFAWVGVVETRAGMPDPKRIAAILNDPSIASQPIEDNLHFASDRGHINVRNYRFGVTYDREPPSYDAVSLPIVRSGTTGRAYLKLPTPRGIVLSSLLALYLASYTTGMLVRYHPGYWMTVVGRGAGDAMAPILSSVGSVVEEQFPRLILEELEA